MGRRFFRRWDKRGEYFEEIPGSVGMFIRLAIFVTPVVCMALYGIWMFFGLLSENLPAVAVICSLAGLLVALGFLEKKGRH